MLAVVAVVLIALGLIGSIVALLGGVLTLVAISIVAARRRGQAMPIEATSELRTPSSQSVVLADVLIIVATLPALGLFWTVVPPIVAIVVIGGVIGTGRGARRAATA